MGSRLDILRSMPPPAAAILRRIDSARFGLGASLITSAPRRISRASSSFARLLWAERTCNSLCSFLSSCQILNIAKTAMLSLLAAADNP